MALTTAAVVAAGASAYGAVKSGQKAPTASATTQIPKWQQTQIQAGYDATNQAANRTVGQAVAGFNPNQTAAFDAIKANQGMGYGDLDQTITNAKGYTDPLSYTDADLARWQDPYQQQVINSTVDDLNMIRGRNRAQINSQAEAAGAFGGDRAVVAQSLNDESMDRTAASAIANLRSSGFNTSANLAQNEAAQRNSFTLNNRGLQLNGNAQLQQMIEARRAAAGQDASNLLTVGNQQQGQDQAERDWAIQRAQLISGVGNGSVGGTTTQTGARPDKLANGLQGLSTGLQFGQSIYNAFNTPKPDPVQYYNVTNASRIGP